MEEIKELKRKVLKLRIIGVIVGILIGMSILIPMCIGRIMYKGALYPNFKMFITSIIMICLTVIIAYEKTRITLIHNVLMDIDKIKMFNEIKSLLGTEEKEVKYLYGVDGLACKIIEKIKEDLDLQYFLSMNGDSAVNLKVKEKKTQRTIYIENITNIELVLENLKQN